jgi:16S rRNA (guanine527-N7)-methyltransferase
MDEDPIGARLNALLANASLAPLNAPQAASFEIYLSLILRWNARTNLTAVRDVDGILARHFVESIACAQALPAEITTLLDYGSGAGFPGIPIALCRPAIQVTLAESHGKKAAFLQEALRTLGLRAKVYADRADSLAQEFDCVTLRAVEQMSNAVTVAARLVRPGGWLVLMTTHSELTPQTEALIGRFAWQASKPLPNSSERVLAIAQKLGSEE